eukprot:g910.t1
MVAAELPGDAYDGLAASAGLNQERSTAMVVPQERRQLTTTVSSWAELRSACASSGTIVLSASFAMGDYTSQCEFSGKAIIVRCDGKVLDANKQGRFFYGSGGGSSLELHGCTLKNGKANVSVVCWRSKRLLLDSSPLFVTG